MGITASTRTRMWTRLICRRVLITAAAHRPWRAASTIEIPDRRFFSFFDDKARHTNTIETVDDPKASLDRAATFDFVTFRHGHGDGVMGVAQTDHLTFGL